jgi:FAD/FMN-containing dehydrogenase
MVGPQPYLQLQQSFDAGTAAKGNRWYSRSHFLPELSDPVIDAIADGLEPFPGEFTMVYLNDEGGAPSRVAVEDTAYPHRNTAAFLHVFAGWIDPASDEENMSWVRGLADRIAEHGSSGVYVNMLSEDEPERIRAAYGPNLDRLSELKAKWDPDNVFRGNHNIVPGSS